MKLQEAGSEAVLNKDFDLLAGKATETIEALTSTIAVIKAAVRALGKLRQIAKVVVVVDLGDRNNSSGRNHTSRNGERTGATGVDVDLEVVLYTSLAGLVGKLYLEVHVLGISSKSRRGGDFALVGSVLGVLVVANMGGLEAGEVLDTIVKAVAGFRTCRSLFSNFHTIENLVGEVTQGVLHTGSNDVVVSGSVNSVSAPDAAVGVVVHHDKLVTGTKSSGAVTNNNNLLHHVHLDGGEGIIALGGDAMGAVGSIVAEVTSADLDLLGIPELVEVPVGNVGIGRATHGVGGDERAGSAGGGLGRELKLGAARDVLELVARASTAVVVVLGDLIDVFAGAVAGAALGAGGAAATLAFVAVEALALAGLAVADALVTALGVVVSLISTVSSVRPSKSLGARAKGAVSALPVLVAGALLVGTADTVAAARVGADGGARGDEGDEKGSLHE
jgi:hypothetical protein